MSLDFAPLTPPGVRPAATGQTARFCWRASFALVFGILAFGCGPSQPPAEDPHSVPPLDDGPQSSGGGAAAASSAEVQAGMDLIQKKDFQGAKRVLAKAHADNPNDPQAAFYLGVANEGLNDAETAKSSYKKALELDPKLVEASVNLSALLLDAGDAAGALEVLNAALKHASRHPELLMNRALALEAAGDKDEAVKAYAAALAVQPDDTELRYNYAELLAGSGRKDQALEELRKLATSEDPKLIQAVANAFGKLKAFSDCVAALDRVIGSQPSAEAHVRRGVCRHEMNDEPGAQADYQSALKLDANSAPAHYYLGVHFRQKGDKKQALSHLDKAIQLGKDTPIAEAAKKAVAEIKSGKK